MEAASMMTETFSVKVKYTSIDQAHKLKISECFSDYEQIMD